MPHQFIITVDTNYPHRFTEEPFTAIYDKDGYIIGAVKEVVNGDDYFLEHI